MTRASGTATWKLAGDAFEACNCAALCPCHISFRQQPTHGYCHGAWAFHVRTGSHHDTALDGLNAAVVVASPGALFDGGWNVNIYIDERAARDQHEGLAAIFSGEVGGPWGVLSRFFAGVDVAGAAISYREQPGLRSAKVDGVLEMTVEGLKGLDTARPVRLLNLPNLLYRPVHNLARTVVYSYRDRGREWSHQGTHALYSTFSWRGP